MYCVAILEVRRPSVVHPSKCTINAFVFDMYLIMLSNRLFNSK